MQISDRRLTALRDRGDGRLHQRHCLATGGIGIGPDAIGQIGHTTPAGRQSRLQINAGHPSQGTGHHQADAGVDAGIRPLAAAQPAGSGLDAHLPHAAGELLGRGLEVAIGDSTHPEAAAIHGDHRNPGRETGGGQSGGGSGRRRFIGRKHQIQCAAAQTGLHRGLGTDPIAAGFEPAHHLGLGAGPSSGKAETGQKPLAALNPDRTDRRQIEQGQPRRSRRTAHLPESPPVAAGQSPGLKVVAADHRIHR